MSPDRTGEVNYRLSRVVGLSVESRLSRLGQIWKSAGAGGMPCEVESYFEPECSDFAEAERDFFASVPSSLFPDRMSMNFLVETRRSLTLTTVPSRVFQPTLSLWMLKETPAISSIPPLGSSRNAFSTRPRAVEKVSPVLVRRNLTTHVSSYPT